MTNREPFFSVTADDCEFKDTFGSGAGGQHRNKKATAIRCTHKPSGAVGFSQEERSQRMNKETAFRRMAETKEFQLWIKMQVAIKTGVEKQIEENVEKLMREKNFKTEVKNEKGKTLDYFYICEADSGFEYIQKSPLEERVYVDGGGITFVHSEYKSFDELEKELDSWKERRKNG